MSSIFIFTRDLRLHDNTALYTALKESVSVIPCFIFDKRQIGDNNVYKSNKCVQFMCESLADLDDQLRKKGGKLHMTTDLNEIIKSATIKAIYITKDYTPFAKLREKELKKICRKHDLKFYSIDGHMLNKIIYKDDGEPYVKFTAFYNASKRDKIPKPFKNSYTNYKKIKVKKIKMDRFYEKDVGVLVHGGRKNALKILSNVHTIPYNKSRDIMAKNTTLLSAYLKFGCISPRELYYRVKNKLRKQLYWRDFYMQIATLRPKKIKWQKNGRMFRKWCKGETGVPIVDAGMRQLNATGWMHNRARMIVANFLIKVLGINWKKGERYFAQRLIDYDYSQNRGNWIWSSSLGIDSQPYYRVFNPYRQSKRFDPKCIYIKRWIPELADVDPKIIHKWYEKFDENIYLRPIVLDIQKEFKKNYIDAYH